MRCVVSLYAAPNVEAPLSVTGRWCLRNSAPTCRRQTHFLQKQDLGNAGLGSKTIYRNHASAVAGVVECHILIDESVGDFDRLRAACAPPDVLTAEIETYCPLWGEFRGHRLCAAVALQWLPLTLSKPS